VESFFEICVIRERKVVFQSSQNLFLTNKENAFKLYLIDLKGGEVDEMDVSPCNPLLDLRLDAQVLSKTLNCSKEKFRTSKAGDFIPGLFFLPSLLPQFSKGDPNGKLSHRSNFLQ
jgi:hypothetical protein